MASGTSRITELSATLQERVSLAAERLHVPGVAVGIYANGEEAYLYYGVTSVTNPLAVDSHTVFQLGSVGKTYTATTLMILVDRGLVSLDQPVRAYLPELRLKDASVAERVTVLNLLNHTAGWAGDVFRDTGDGDDALARYVAELATVDQVHPPGTLASYNNAAVNVAGRVIERVTGQTYESAVRDLVFEPLGLNESNFFLKDIVTRRFVVGHQERDGQTVVARPWGLPRAGNPAGGVLSTASDALRYARFHLGDGMASDGRQVLSPPTLHRMQQPTAPMGSGHVGISWMIEQIDGVAVVHHGGSTVGQQAEMRLVPEREFAITALTNHELGHQLHGEITDWALEAYLGLKRPADEPLSLNAAELDAYVGSYDGALWVADVSIEDDQLQLAIAFTEKGIAEVQAAGLETPTWETCRLAVLPGDRYLILDGENAGLKGNFVRQGERVVAFDLGRVAPRIA